MGAVGFIEGRVASAGCSWVTDAEGAAMCEAIGFGPEDPMADACVGLIVWGCPKILSAIERGIRSPSQICGAIGFCDRLNALRASSSVDVEASVTAPDSSNTQSPSNHFPVVALVAGIAGVAVMVGLVAAVVVVVLRRRRRAAAASASSLLSKE